MGRFLQRMEGNRVIVRLADEPTENLDSHTSAELMRILQALNAQQELIILVVTHEPGIAQYTGRIIVFKGGTPRSHSGAALRMTSGTVERVAEGVRQLAAAYAM